MSFDTNEILELIENTAKEKAFSVNSLQKNITLKYKRLNTSHLKQIISTISEGSITLTHFNTIINRIMQECLLNNDVSFLDLNVVDRLLFVLNARIQSLSKTVKYAVEGEIFEVDLENLKESLVKNIKEKEEFFKENVAEEDELLVQYGISNIEADKKMSDEMYSGKDLTIEEDSENINDIIGTILVNEISKSIRTICIRDKSVNFSELSFADRIKLVEKLPISIVNQIVQYLEGYKRVITQSLTDSNGVSVKVDGSLFVF